MRDGVILHGDVIRPRQPRRYPTLVYRTPYGKHYAVREFSIYRKAAQRGYAIVLQDVRGRYASDGDFFAYLHEGKDGYDTIRVGCAPALVRRERRHLWSVLSGRCAMARCG